MTAAATGSDRISTYRSASSSSRLSTPSDSKIRFRKSWSICCFSFFIASLSGVWNSCVSTGSALVSNISTSPVSRSNKFSSIFSGVSSTVSCQSTTSIRSLHSTMYSPINCLGKNPFFPRDSPYHISSPSPSTPISFINTQTFTSRSRGSPSVSSG